MNYEYRTSSVYEAIGCNTEQNICQNYMIQLPGIYFIGYRAMEGDKELVALIYYDTITKEIKSGL